MHRVFKTKHFSRWMRKTELTDKALCKAVKEMSDGLIDGGIVKKRVGVAGKGKRCGVRTIVATNRGNRWFFVYGFEKNTRSNITTKEKEALQYLAEDLLGLSTELLERSGRG